jgi:hypothetical protein
MDDVPTLTNARTGSLHLLRRQARGWFPVQKVCVCSGVGAWAPAASVSGGDRKVTKKLRLTAEQTMAFAQFRQLAKPCRLRVVADAEGWPVIPGRYGQIEWFDGQSLAVYSDHRRLFEKLWAIPGMRHHQTGDHEMRAIFPPEVLEQVAGAIKARRRRTLSPEAASKLGSGTAYRATSAPQKATSSMWEGCYQGTRRTKPSKRAKTDVSASHLRSGVRGFSSFKKRTRGKFLRGVSSLNPAHQHSTPAGGVTPNPRPSGMRSPNA